MNSPIGFSGPLLKAERAEHHIAELENIFRRHIRFNEQAAIPSKNRNNRKRLVGSPLPRHTPTIIGDAIHNMRVALDHAYCVLVEANLNRVGQFTRFPFGNGTRQDIVGSINGHAKQGSAPSAEVIAHIVDVIQPYPGGNGSDLLALHTLDIADKHMSLIPTDQMTSLHNLEFENGTRIRGITLQTPAGMTAVELGAGLKGSANNKVRIEICFSKGQPLDGHPVIPTLKRLLVRVRETIEGLNTYLPSPAG